MTRYQVSFWDALIIRLAFAGVKRLAPYNHLMGGESVPGEALVRRGLADLRSGLETEAALLVSVGAPRLRRLGFDVTSPFVDPEHRLYAYLSRSGPDAAHGRYNALLRRLVSFEHSWPCAR